MTDRISIFILAITLVFFLITTDVFADEYYVSPEGLDANTGTQGSPWSLGKANVSVEPGDTIMLLEGTYTVPIQPARSGKKGNRIVYRAANPHKAVFTKTEGEGADPEKFGHLYGSIIINNRSYITIDSIKVVDVYRFILALRSHHITITNCHFENAPGWQGARFRDVGDGMRIINNFFKNGVDMLSLIGGNYHIIEGNTFDTDAHTCLALHGTNYSVLRGNRFINPVQKLVQVQSFERGNALDNRMENQSEKVIMHMVIEDNIFGPAGNGKGYSGIQHSGHKIILRRNIFWKCDIGITWASYRGRANDAEAWHASSNRFYNNIIYNCGVPADSDRDSTGMVFETNLPLWGDHGQDQMIINNIIFRNHCGTWNDRKGKAEDTVPSIQITFVWDQGPHAGRFFNNLIMADRPGQKVFFWVDAVVARPVEQRSHTLKEYEKRFKEWAAHNIEADPMFVDADKGDFRLSSGSPCIDAGGSLTRTTVRGNGRVVNVGDATFFSDGFGIVEHDIVRIGESLVSVVKVDYVSNTLVVDRTIKWKRGDWVSLDYKGKAPDMGIIEFGSSD